MEKKYRRHVKEEARPLVILRNFGPVDFVFDVSDTEEDKLPDEIVNPFKIEDGRLDITRYNYLLENLERYGIAQYACDFGSQYAGCIKKIDRKKRQIHTNQNIYTISIDYMIEINRNLKIEEQFVTMVHELGHLFCGHLGTPNEKLWPQRDWLDINTQEFEAESVAWLVSGRLGIKNPSEVYLKSYLTKNNEIPSISMETVLKAVSRVEGMLSHRVALEKELIVKKEKTEKKKSFQSLLP